MAEYFLQRLDRAAVHHEPTREVVPQVVKVEVVEHSLGHRALKRPSDVPRRPNAADATVLGDGGQDVIDRLSHPLGAFLTWSLRAYLQALGKATGALGGAARAKAMTKKERSDAARFAVRMRCDQVGH